MANRVSPQGYAVRWDGERQVLVHREQAATVLGLDPSTISRYRKPRRLQGGWFK